MIEFKKKIKCSIYANGWNDTDEYSTSEVKTNKVWIDGKPIYRKVVTGVANTLNAWREVLPESTSVDRVITARLVSHDRAGTNGAASQSIISIVFANGSVQVLNTLSRTGIYDMYVLEYTKTTD